MLDRRSFLLVACAVLLTACATIPAPSVSVTDLAQFHLAGVELRSVEGIRAWPAEEEAFIKMHGLDEAAAAQIAQHPIFENAELKAHAAGVLTGLLQTDMRMELSGVLTGHKPAKAVVTVTRFDVPSVARRVFTDRVATMSARVALVDSAGATIVESPDLFASAQLFGGLSTLVASAVEASSGNEPGRLLARNFSARYRAWLLQK